MQRFLNLLSMMVLFTACAVQGNSVTGLPPKRGNTPPLVSVAEIAQGNYKKESVITVSPKGWHDADGDPEWYRYQWYVDGRPVAGQTMASLSGEFFDKANDVYCQVTPFDAFGAGLAVNSNTVRIGNTPPTLRAAAFSAGSFTAGEDLRLVPLDPFDPDAETVVYIVAWYVNDVLVSGESALTLPRVHYVRGDAVHAVVTPYDGDTEGAAYSTVPVTIQNSLPRITVAMLASGPHDKRNAVGALVDGEDADHDLLSFAFRWYVNGVSVPTATGSLLTPSHFKRGDAVWFEARAHDGFGFGAWAESPQTLILNAPPVAPTAQLYPAHVSTSDPIWVEATAGLDADGDQVALSYAWYKNDVLEDFESSTTAIVSSPYTDLTRPGDTWRAVVYASDSTATAQAGTNSIVVQKVKFREVRGYDYFDEQSNDHWAVGCALDTRDALWCWGDRQIPVFNGSYWTSVTGSVPKRLGGSWRTLGTHGRCGIQTDGTLWCWGFAETATIPPTQAGSANDWVAIYESPGSRPLLATYGQNYCAVNTTGELWCWGQNDRYSLGLGIEGSPHFPTLVTSATGWTDVSLAFFHGCGITTGGVLRCWGDGNSGELGIGISNCDGEPNCQLSYATVVTDMTGWVDVATAKFSSCAVRDDGTLWCWGRSDSVATWENDTGNDDSVYPAMVGNETDWVSVDGTVANYCARKVDGQAYCWGTNHFGQLGVGSEFADYDSCPFSTCLRWPQEPVAQIDDFITVSPQGDKTCGIREDGSLWCWGSNRNFALGIGWGPSYQGSDPAFCVGQEFSCSTVPREIYQ